MTVWLAGVILYVNGLSGDFVHDDVSAITTNPDVLGTNPISQVFLNDFWGKPMADPSSHKSYRPLTILSFRINHTVFGLRPVGFHLVNVLLHSFMCLLLTRLMLSLLRLSQGTSLSAGLVFATHPLHTEAVTGLVGRADVLSALFFLLTLITYNRAMQSATDEIDEGVVFDEVGAAVDSRIMAGNEGKREKGPFGGEAKGGLGGGGGLIERRGPSVDGQTGERRFSFSGGVRTEEGGGGGWGTGGGGEEEEEQGGARGKRRRRRRRHGEHVGVWLRITGIIALAGTMCKENALTSLVGCAAWDLICQSHNIRRLFSNQWGGRQVEALRRRLMCLAVMGSGILVFRLWMQRGSAPVFSDQDNPAAYSSSLITRVLTFLFLPAFNGWLLVCPWTLAHDWQMGSIPLVTSFRDVRNLASLTFYISLILIFRAGCCLKGHESRAVFLGLVLLVVPFLPATNLFFTVGFVVAERILYIPSLGWSILVGVGAARVGRLRGSGLLLLILVFSCRTVVRNRDWESRATLFTAGLRSLPHNAKMHYNFANLQKDLGNTESAKHHYAEAIRLWPGHSSAHNNLGTLLNDTKAAEEHFQQALRAHPHHARAYYNLATLRQQQGRLEEAARLLEESLRHDTQNREAIWALAELYGQTGRRGDAENLHLTLLASRPSDPLVHNNYAVFLHNMGRREAALRHYEAALVLDPQHTEALVNTAMLMRALQHNTQAEMLYKRALAVSWEAEIEESLGKLYLNTGRLDEAEYTFSSVLRRHPEMISSRVYLARVKLQQRSYLESEDLLRQVLTKSPSHQEALLQLSLLYTHTNRTLHALALAQQAARNCSTPPTLCAHLHAHYADLLHDMHNVDEAMKSYLMAVQLEPSLTHAHVNLGALFHTKGDYAKAWNHYLTALGQDPSNALLLENMEKLRRLSSLQNPIQRSPTSIPNCLNNS